MTVMMTPAAMAVVMAVKADTHADAADMNANADTGGSRGCAQQRQGENGNEQFLHDNSS